MDIRRPYLEERKKELRKALLNPALTEDQYKQIKKSLDTLGKPKEYGDHIPFPVGAIQVP